VSGRAAGIGLLVLAASLSAAADPSPKRLRREIERVVSRPEFDSAFWGIEVRSLDTGRTLYALNAERAFRPASTLKLVTTAAALDLLGPDARLRTTVETAARLDGQGRLLGDVLLVGRGDPGLSARPASEGRATALGELANSLVAGGVRRIEGRVVGNEAAFTGERRGPDWTWEDLVWGYGAPVSALSFNDNVVELSLEPGEREGDPAVLEVFPRTPLLRAVSSVATGGPGEEEDVRLMKEGPDTVQLSGRLPGDGRWEGRVAVSDPARYAASAFAALLEARGVLVTGGVEASSARLAPGLRVLASHESAPLSEIVRAVNKDSLNLHAEMLLRLLGLSAEGEGSLEKGQEAVAEFLRRLNVPAAGWGLVDGSGLARTDVLTPRGLALLLVAMDRHAAAEPFRDSLPVAGVDGTLENRMRGTPAEGRVHAETGTLRLANALAGYVETVRGDRLAFAIVVNNHAGRSREAVRAIDDIAVALAEAR
jgi:D-alanyl-D-alanine carboxypeptidase/D-alanyl-D-alanine-endopeptidase (penicillin-binding protein 4)